MELLGWELRLHRADQQLQFRRNNALVGWVSAIHRTAYHGSVLRVVSVCEGFRTTADRDRATGTGVVVGKPPGKEPAGSCGKEYAAAAYGDLIAVGRVAEAVKAPGSCDWR
jgi:hypothetical protein